MNDSLTGTPDAGTRTPGLDRLVRAIREEVRAGRDSAETARAVAGHVARALEDPDLLAERHCAPAGDGYRQHVLHVEPDGGFSVVCLVWLPGQETPVHDHVSWCVPGVVRGREEETRYRLVGARRAEATGPRRHGDGASSAGEGGVHLREAGREINEPGAVVTLTPPGDIHRVRNPGPGKAVSIHVYGADIGELGSSIRRSYELPVRGGEGPEPG